MSDDKRVTLSLELCRELHEWMRTLSDLNAQSVAEDLKFEMDRHRETAELSEEAIRESERKRISGMMFFRSFEVSQIDPAPTARYWARLRGAIFGGGIRYRAFPPEALEKLSDSADTNDLDGARDAMRSIWLFENGKAAS